MSAGELITRCFHARTTAHILHLKTRSYAVHKALQDFYEPLIPLVDSFAETYQGLHGLVEHYNFKYVQYSDALELIDDLSDWIEQNRYKCCDAEDTALQNIIDEILALIHSTRYKLKFLK